MRSIAVFAGARGDLWPLGPVIAALHQHPDLSCLVLAAGDLDEAEVRSAAGAIDGFDVRVITGGGVIAAPLDAGRFLSRVAEGTAAALADDRPDILVVMGDRYELLGAVGAALVHGLPVAHLGGGDVTLGAIDDSIRHAITKLSHLHLCATAEHASRVRRLGEEPWRLERVCSGGRGTRHWRA